MMPPPMPGFMGAGGFEMPPELMFGGMPGGVPMMGFDPSMMPPGFGQSPMMGMMGGDVMGGMQNPQYMGGQPSGMMGSGGFGSPEP